LVPPCVEGLHSQIRAVEAEVFSPSRSNPAERIYKLKRQVLALDEAVSPLTEEVSRLSRDHSGLIPEEMVPYFRDVHDHLLRLVTQIESFGDLLTSVLTANLTQISVRQNEDISAWAAIIAVPTMIAGVYGMNLEHMPELEWACALLYSYFRRIGWL
jgi:magnesium transporter